jgi:hypothetical protein
MVSELGSVTLDRLVFGEAVPAIDWPSFRWFERDLAFLSAI